MRPLFKDPEHQAAFDRNGWLCVPMLEADEVAHLLGVYNGLPQEQLPAYGFHVSMDKQDRALKERVVDELIRVIQPKAAQYFQDFQIFTGSFVVKEHNPKGIVPPHQDWTFVDEARFNSLTVWTALVDTDMENGCMGVINGSHRFFDYLRASPSPQCKTPISDHMFTIFPYLQLVPMKAGEALIFDNRTIHASPPNTAPYPRIAAGIGVTQADAELFHHYLLPNVNPERLERYKVGKEFFMDYNNGMLSDFFAQGRKPPGVEAVATLERRLPSFSPDEILAMIKSHPANTMNVPLVERLARLFHYNPDGTPQAAAQPQPELAPATPGGVKGFFKRLFG